MTHDDYDRVVTFFATPGAPEARIERMIRDVAKQTPEEWYRGHSPNCSFGGLSCLYWIADAECNAPHANIHAHDATEEKCPW